MKFIEVTRNYNGKKVMLIAANIKWIDKEGVYTGITFIDGSYMTVKESYEEIHNALVKC
jgi:uncharacterized protein YlzI (FlbEa/FlbD family)